MNAFLLPQLALRTISVSDLALLVPTGAVPRCGVVIYTHYNEVGSKFLSGSQNSLSLS